VRRYRFEVKASYFYYASKKKKNGSYIST